MWILPRIENVHDREQHNVGQTGDLRSRLSAHNSSGAALQKGVEKHRVEGVPIKVYSPGKTVADCFKFRNKVGLDLALEALRETWRARRATMDEFHHFARVCRVANIMQPYLESLTWPPPLSAAKWRFLRARQSR